ncbi:WhiB family transcriptional regulator [Rhodococcus sp. I2R]|uniref:WhiB family transcriptional regulator n=1 Tax=Rhodococcus sp. I2R TaxID=2855445 RepID=UPI0022A81951|nr:WhiB family transcriptional regulator [Rhodococcus sp. I2R]MCC8930713.1 WhiB family transcriptional regulator [Rhodococcus sp. I2R]
MAHRRCARTLGVADARRLSPTTQRHLLSPPVTVQLRLELPAKSICAHCPVLMQYQSYAVAHQELHGIWDGLSARERSRISAGQPTLRQNDIR